MRGRGGIGIAKGPSCLKMWLKEDGFVERVKEWWHSYNVLGDPYFVLAKKLRFLRAYLRRQNKEEMGNVSINFRLSC